MNTITVSKDTLLKILKDNREKHKNLFETAMLQYRIELKTYYTKKLKDLENIKKPIDTTLDLRAPISKVKDYDEVIEMLEMHSNPVIDIDAYQYRQYIKDDWVWSKDIRSVNVVYANTFSNSNSDLCTAGSPQYDYDEDDNET